MEWFSRCFNPSTFDLDKIEPINTAFVMFSFIGEDKYERVEAEKYKKHNDEYVTYFKNDVRISQDMYEMMTNDLFKVEKNRVVFLDDYRICFLDIYIKPNYQILPVVNIEFASEEESLEYEPLKWFGEEVSIRFFNEKALWSSFQAIQS
jgi:hypothetical protein